MIKEIIIVEGKDDITRVKEAVDADVIATHGIHISKNKLNEISELTKNRGAIILTDPDHAGEIIRKKIKKILNCPVKDAYITQKEGYLDGDVGIENADREIIKRAIENAKPIFVENSDEFDHQFLFDYGLTGKDYSAKLREDVSKHLGIGNPNAKEFLKRLNSFHFSKDDVIKIINELLEEEN